WRPTSRSTAGCNWSWCWRRCSTRWRKSWRHNQMRDLGMALKQLLLTVAVGVLLLSTAPLGSRPAGAQPGPRTHELKATPRTVVWGYYDAKAKPVLRIRSGDVVQVQTLITSSPSSLEGAFLPPAQVEQALRDIFREVKDRGPGGHILTGPIYVEGAEPG